MSCDPLTAFLNCCQNCFTTSATSVPIFYRVFTTSKWARRAFSRFKRFKSLSTAHPVRTKKQNGFRVLFHSQNLLVQQARIFSAFVKIGFIFVLFLWSILGKKRCLLIDKMSYFGLTFTVLISSRFNKEFHPAVCFLIRWKKTVSVSDIKSTNNSDTNKHLPH